MVVGRAASESLARRLFDAAVLDAGVNTIVIVRPADQVEQHCKQFGGLLAGATHQIEQIEIGQDAVPLGHVPRNA